MDAPSHTAMPFQCKPTLRASIRPNKMLAFLSLAGLNAVVEFAECIDGSSTLTVPGRVMKMFRNSADALAGPLSLAPALVSW